MQSTIVAFTPEPMRTLFKITLAHCLHGYGRAATVPRCITEEKKRVFEHSEFNRSRHFCIQTSRGKSRTRTAGALLCAVGYFEVRSKLLRDTAQYLRSTVLRMVNCNDDSAIDILTVILILLYLYNIPRSLDAVARQAHVMGNGRTPAASLP